MNGTGCDYTPGPFLAQRFYLVAIFGSSISIISFCANVFLFSVLCRKKQHRNSHCLYLLLLAFCDLSIAFSYIPLMSVNVLADYLESAFLLKTWFTYMRVLITFCHIAMTTSAFLILAACFERYCVTCWPSKIHWVNKNRRSIACGAIFMGFLTKFTHFFEFRIIHNENCTGEMTEYDLSASDLASDYYYSLLWRIGFRNLVTIWLPFFLLLFMNFKIVRVLRRKVTETAVLDKPREVERKKRVRSATRTFVCVCFSYLLANTLNVIITMFEYIDPHTLMYTELIVFYSFGVDMVSILTILAGSFRPVIYFVCMPQLRKEILLRFKTATGRHRYKVDQLNNNTEERSFGYTSTILMRISEMLLKYPQFSSKTSIESVDESDENERSSREVYL
ncbi:hypothetical protein M3Y94_00164900 [Aphelenchoides besseyi]|nr:hypothetical protein M3Y94_00164900 [Aphelenchoides besseyi]